MKKTINKLPTVTLALSAYNEEHNIGAFLTSVLQQIENGFILEHIWIFSDGSTDKTVEVAQSFPSAKITVFSDSRRIGKSARLNEIYSRLTSDFLLQSDADVIFSQPYIVRDMIQPLINDKNVAMYVCCL